MATAKRLAGLKSALETASGKARPSAAAPPPTATGKSAGRIGKIHVGAWLPREYKTSLRMIQVKKASAGTEDHGFQELIAEALNDLFSKYNVPVIGEN